MKYLRKYNESIDQDDIVLNCLDLIDSGFEIQELSGGLSKFIFRLERRDTISLPEGVDLHNLDWLEENYPENMFYIIKDNYRQDLYGYRIATENTDKEITESQRELLVDLVSITERLARYLRRDDIAAKISFTTNPFYQSFATNMFRRGGAILTYNDICIDFLFEQATKLIPKLESFSLLESNNDFISDLTNFCEENLVYLIDYGLRINVEKLRGYSSFDDTFRQQNNLATHYNGGYQFRLENYKNPTIIRLDMFNIENSCWSEIKDSIIPFLVRLKSEYNISEFINSNKKDEIEFITNSHSSLYYNLDDVINNKDLAPGFTFDYFNIETIFIIVDGYKIKRDKDWFRFIDKQPEPKGKVSRFIKRFF